MVVNSPIRTAAAKLARYSRAVKIYPSPRGKTSGSQVGIWMKSSDWIGDPGVAAVFFFAVAMMEVLL